MMTVGDNQCVRFRDVKVKMTVKVPSTVPANADPRAVDPDPTLDWAHFLQPASLKEGHQYTLNPLVGAAAFIESVTVSLNGKVIAASNFGRPEFTWNKSPFKP